MRNPEKVSARRANLLGDRPGAFAEAKHLHISATKVRRVIDLVRGKDVITALAILRYAPQAAALPARKALQSAVANAEHQEGLEVEDLYISAIFADEGVTLRRIKARAKGSASRILKRGAHLTVVVEPFAVEEEEPVVKAEPRAARAPKPAMADAPAKPKAKPTPKPKAEEVDEEVETKKPVRRRATKPTTDESEKEA